MSDSNTQNLVRVWNRRCITNFIKPQIRFFIRIGAKRVYLIENMLKASLASSRSERDNPLLLNNSETGLSSMKITDQFHSLSLTFGILCASAIHY